MRGICKKIGKKAVLTEIPDECKRLGLLAEYLETELVTAKVAPGTVAVFEPEGQPAVKVGEAVVHGDFLLLGSAGAWLKDVDMELYTNRSMIPCLWTKIRRK